MNVFVIECMTHVMNTVFILLKAMWEWPKTLA